MVVPAIEVEIGEKEDHQRCGKRNFRSRAPYLLVSGRYLHQLVPEAEIDADIGQNRPCKRGGGRKERCALDHEKDGQEKRQKAGNAKQDAAI